MLPLDTTAIVSADGCKLNLKEPRIISFLNYCYLVERGNTVMKGKSLHTMLPHAPFYAVKR